jgi:hypothetical protein
VQEYRIGVCINPEDPHAIANGVHQIMDLFSEGVLSREKIKWVFEQSLCLERQMEPLWLRLLPQPNAESGVG